MRLLILEDSPIQAEILIDTLNRVYPSQVTSKLTDRLVDFNKLADSEAFDAFLVDLNVLDAKAAEVAAALHGMPTQLQRKIIIHSSESWLNVNMLGLAKFQTTPKGSSQFELRRALNSVLTTT
ncbi:MAG: hypothetical protein QE278_06425 [Limnobacter sp.]|nr:hypothetical protein [Limnobacter sp.]